VDDGGSGPGESPAAGPTCQQQGDRVTLATSGKLN